MPEINQPVSLADLHTLPLGSQVTYDSVQWTVEADGIYDENYRRAGVYARHQMNRPTLTSIGSRLLIETVQQYGQRLRTLTLGQAFGAGINRDPIYSIFEQESIPALERPILGMWVHITDQDIQSILPTGAVGVSGDHTSPHYGVWVWSQGRWNPALGGRSRSVNPAFQILWVPEGTDLGTWDEPREDEADRLVALKTRLYEVGLKAKTANSWCGEYEAAMGRAGIDDHLGRTVLLATHGHGGEWLEQPRRASEFDVITPGSLLQDHESMPVSNRTYFVRVGDDPSHGLLHATLTDEIGVFRPDGVGDYNLNRAAWVYFVALPKFEQGARVESTAHLQQALVGSEISNGGYRWVKTGPDEWTHVSLAGRVEVTAPRTDMSTVRGTSTAVASRAFTLASDTVWITTEPPFEGVVGERVDRRQMILAPVGAQVRDSGTAWEKRDTGRWVRVGRTDAGHHPSAFTMGVLRWERLPALAANSEEASEEGAPPWPTGSRADFTVPFDWPAGCRPSLHSRVTREQVDMAPIGAQVRLASSGATWRREEHGWRGNNSNQLHTVESFERRLGEMTWNAVNPIASDVGAVLGNAGRAKAPVGSYGTADGTKWAKVSTTEWVSESGGRQDNVSLTGLRLLGFGLLPQEARRAEQTVVWS